MDGRIENELRIEKAIGEKLGALPGFVSDWETSLKASGRTAATRRDYVYKAEAFLKSIRPDAAGVTPDDITAGTVTAYLAGLMVNGDGERSSDSYRQTVWYCLNSLLGHMERSGLIGRNYAADIDKPKNRDLRRINQERKLLTKADFRKIMDGMADPKSGKQYRDRAMLLILMTTGMRKTALVTINTGDADLTENRLTVVDKGGITQAYDLNAATAGAIADWLRERETYCPGEKSDALFISRDGSRISRDVVDAAVRSHTEKALGVALSPHKLRSGFCSIIYSQTGDVEFTRKAVGHASAATTLRYIVTDGKERARASEIMGKAIAV